MHPDRRSRQKGQSLVETAFVVLPLMMLITGLMDIAQVMMSMHLDTERARAGARYAATHQYDVDRVKRWVSYNNAEGAGSRLLGLDPAAVSVRRLPSEASPEYVEVRISRRINFVTPFIPASVQPRPAVAIAALESQGSTQ